MQVCEQMLFAYYDKLMSQASEIKTKFCCVYLWPWWQKQPNYCLAQGKCDIFNRKVCSLYLWLFFNKKSWFKCDIFSPIVIHPLTPMS